MNKNTKEAFISFLSLFAEKQYDDDDKDWVEKTDTKVRAEELIKSLREEE